MPRKVRGPDGVVHIFPDDATDEEIAHNLEGLKEGPSVMSPTPSLLDRASDLIPAITGTVGGIVGGAGGTVAGFGVGGLPGAVGGATLGGGAGEAVRQLLDRFRGIEAPATMGGAALDIAKEAGLQGASEVVGAGVNKAVGAGAKAVYRGYLKPSLAKVNVGKAREIVDTALAEALPVTKGGEVRAERLIADINKQVNASLQNTKGTVDLHQVAEKVRAFAKGKYYKPGVDNADFEAAMAVADTLDKHPSLGLPAGAAPTRVDVSAAQANEVKQSVRPNSRAYGQQGSAPEAATRKAAGSEMRQAIEGVEPSVGPLNDRERRLIDAKGAITQAAGREENRSALFGMPTLLAGSIGAEETARTRDPASGLATALAIRLALSPAMMTRAAILASKIAKNGYTASAAARMAIEAVRSGSKDEGQSHPQPPQ